MNSNHDSERLAEIAGCFSEYRTVSGRRRREPDEDALANPCVCPFLVDECKFLDDKSTRRLGLKTQVVTGADNAHIRTRATHTNEVKSASVKIASILGSNPHLAGAIATAHDIGHAPLGHLGERYISDKTKKEFRNSVMSVVIAQKIARNGEGLNATHEVLSSIAHGRGKAEIRPDKTMLHEAAEFMYGDKFAYITADYNDLRRIGIPLPRELDDLMNKLGANQRERMRRLITDLCLESAENGFVTFTESESAKIFFRAKDLMYKIYDRVNVCNPEQILDKVYTVIEHVWAGEIDPALMLALMTDKDIETVYSAVFPSEIHLRQTTAWEFVETLRGREIKWWEPDLDW